MLASCIPEPVDLEIPQAEPKLVVASQMIFDQILLVQVSRSFGALEFSEEQSDTLNQELLNQILVDSARVVLISYNQTDTLIGVGSGLYLGLNTELIAGQTYQLSVYDSVTEELVFAESEVLPQAELNELDYSFSFDSITFQDTVFRDTALAVSIGFDDFLDENYYMVNMYRVSLDTANNNLEGLASTLIGDGGNTTFALTDQLYTEQTIRDTLVTTQFRPGDTVAVALSHISPTYYQYLSTRSRSAGSIFVSLLGEPVSYPSNVDGGYGMFNLHLPNIRFLILRE